MTTGLQFGVAVPQSAGAEEHATRDMAQFVRSAEGYGLHSLWVQEQMLGADPSFEPIVNLAFVAALTTSIRLGTAAVIAPARNPVVLAKQLGSLDRLSQGRLIVGLAIGDMPSLYSASGITDGIRGARLDELVQIMKGFWTQDKFSYESPTRSIVGAAMAPKPWQSPHPPLWFGGRSAAAMRRAVREGDGWVSAGGTSTTQFTRLAAEMRILVEQHQREKFSIAKKLYIAVEDDRETAKRQIVDWFTAHWGAGENPETLAESVAVFGTAEDCAEAIAKVAESNPDLIILNPVYREQEQLARLAETVIPLIAG